MPQIASTSALDLDNQDETAIIVEYCLVAAGYLSPGASAKKYIHDIAAKDGLEFAITDLAHSMEHTLFVNSEYSRSLFLDCSSDAYEIAILAARKLVTDTLSAFAIGPTGIVANNRAVTKLDEIYRINAFACINTFYPVLAFVLFPNKAIYTSTLSSRGAAIFASAVLLSLVFYLLAGVFVFIGDLTGATWLFLSTTVVVCILASKISTKLASAISFEEFAALYSNLHCSSSERNIV